MSWLSWTLFLILAFIVGYVHTDIAIRMLFRPHRDIRFFGIGWQGLIPRRKPDIAKKLGDVVVNQLLQEDRIVARLHQPDMLDGMRRALRDVADRLLAHEAGTLHDLLPVTQREAVRAMGIGVFVSLAREGEKWLASPAGTAAVRDRLEQLLGRTVHDVIGHRRGELRELALARVRELIAHPDLVAPLRQLLDRAVVYVANTGTPLGQMLPADIKPMVLLEVARLTPLLLERFAEAMMAPENVGRIQAAVRSGIEKELQGRNPDAGVVERLLQGDSGEILRVLGQKVFREKILSKTDEMVCENVPRIREVLLEPDNVLRVNRELGSVVESFLARNIADVLAAVPTATLDRVYGHVAENAAGYLRRPEVAATLEPLVDRLLEGLWQMPLRDLLRLAGFDQARIDTEIGVFCAWLAHERLVTLAAAEAPGWTDALLQLPIGRLSAVLTPERREACLNVILEKLPAIIDPVVPGLLKQLDMRTLVEQQINAYSSEELEKLIVSVAQKELFTITWLGGLLGALIAVCQVLFR